MRERRESFRVEWNSPAKMYDCDGRFVRACIVSNFSNGGAKITGIDIAAVADEFMLRITPHSRATPARIKLITSSVAASNARCGKLPRPIDSAARSGTSSTMWGPRHTFKVPIGWSC